MRTASLFAFLFLVLLLVGCGGGQQTVVSYDSEKNRTTYETRKYTVSSDRRDAGLASTNKQSVKIRAVAQCRGANCAPQTVRLVFEVIGGELSLTGAGGEIVANGRRIAWSSVEAGGRPSRGGGRLYAAEGVFATVDIPLRQLEQIATASKVEGSIGGQPLDFDSDVQSGFRKLLQRIPGRSSRKGSSGGTSDEARTRSGRT